MHGATSDCGYRLIAVLFAHRHVRRLRKQCHSLNTLLLDVARRRVETDGEEKQSGFGASDGRFSRETATPGAQRRPQQGRLDPPAHHRGREQSLMWLQRFFLRRMALFFLIQEARSMAQDDCKHEGQAGTYCGLCGKQLEADAEVAGALERTLTRLMKDKYGMEPKAPPKKDGEPPASTLADKIFGAKKKKEEKK